VTAIGALRAVLRSALGGGQQARRALGGLEPASRSFGANLGKAIDRHYIESFLERNSAAIQGRVLEVGDAAYTRRFGRERVSASDVLYAAQGNPQATLVGDLSSGRGIPEAAFDCLILTQVLQYVFDVRAGVAGARAALKTGGVVLATLPGISQISRYDDERWGDYWRFTPASARRLFADAFGEDAVQVEAHGNVLVAAAFLYGVPLHEIEAGELEREDPDYPMLITVKAERRGAA
jgi:SAM-dependent methyltransferase